MTQPVSITLNTTRLDLLRGRLAPRAAAILDKVAFDVERTAKPLTNIDTGAMRSSVYVSGGSGRGTPYSQAVSEALSLRPEARVVPEVQPASQWERIVGVAVEYSYWQELDHPYLEPAVQQNRPLATAAWSELFA